MSIRHAAVGIALFAAGSLAAAPGALAQAASSGSSLLTRGEYLVTFGGCHDCHSPKVMTPNGLAAHKTRLLSGPPADAQLTATTPGAVGATPNQWAAMTQ